MYIVEKKDGSEAARWNNLTNPNWPDGSSTSGRLKPDDMVRKGEDGETYTVKEVLPKSKGSGPRVLSVSSPVRTKSTGEWHITTSRGAALPPAPDPKPGDNGYDYGELRKKEYAVTMPLGDQADAILKWSTAINEKKAEVDAAIDGITSITKDDEKAALKAALGPVFDLPADLDAIIGKWAAVKAKFPKS